MVHVRINEREANPNPHVNFVTALPADDQEEARQLLRALAAQVKPVMQAHGFVINSFEEYEYNQVFAGRNWNNGETVELVLRGPGGGFVSPGWLMSTLCHELAHIEHMNHGPAFQALWSKLRNEVRELQSRGYYGDGFWSSGTRLADLARVGSETLEPGELPEYICGGAQKRARPVRRRRRAPIAPSNSTGAQTAKKRKLKAGSRVTSKGAFAGAGTGVTLNEGSEGGETGRGTGFGKQARSKRAREERASAIERRLQALQGTAGGASDSKTEELLVEPDSDDEDGEEHVHETDAERRRALLASVHDGDPKGEGTSKAGDMMKSTTLMDWWGDLVIPTATQTRADIKQPTHDKVLELSDDEDLLAHNTKPSHSTRSDSKGRKASSKQKAKAPPTSVAGATPSLKLGSIVTDEVEYRKKDNLGMAPGSASYTLGGGSSAPPKPKRVKTSQNTGGWSCPACTLNNEPGHLACAACGTERGGSWSGAYA